MANKNLYKILKLPRFLKFRGTNKLVSPYEKFYKWAIDELLPMGKYLYKDTKGKMFNLPNGKGLNVTSFYLCEEDAQRLRDLNVDWLMMFHGMSKKLAKSQEVYFSFHISPGTFEKKSRKKVYIPGYLYVFDDFLMNENEQ